jgi:hypothetical protein
MLQLDADEELLLLARSVYAPLCYRISYLKEFNLPDDTILSRQVGEDIMNRWRMDAVSNSSQIHRGRLRGAFWAQVHRLVGSTHVAKCLINYGLSNMDCLSNVLHEVVEHKDTDLHKNLVIANALPLTETEKGIRANAKWFAFRCHKAHSRLQEIGGQLDRHSLWLHSQRAIYAAMHNAGKRTFSDLTADAVQGAGLHDVYESIE